VRLTSAVRRGLGRWLIPPPPIVPIAPDPLDIRTQLSHAYIRGQGIEFGALHSALNVQDGVTVQYADFEPAETLQALFPDVENIKRPDIVSDLESMKGIETASQDFVIANHVLEHVEDPLRALRSVARVLRPGGIAYLALPDKRFTFDSKRAITPLDHLIRDHDEGPDNSLLGHFREWVACVDDLHGDAGAAKVAAMTDIRANIHFHVWDYPAMMEFFAYVAKQPSVGLEVESSRLNGIEVIWILRRRNELT
jgi:SAM-dependent methyltransferase